MKILIIYLLLISCSKIYAWEALESWNENYEQELVINCAPEDQICQQLCNETSSCRIPAKSCKDCVGTGILMSYFYQEVGKWFVNSNEEISEKEFINTVNQENFVILTNKSPYNIFSPINDLKMEKAFNNLCYGDNESYPLVVGELNRFQVLTSIKYVICHLVDGAIIYRLNSIPEIERSEQYIQ